MTQEERVLRFLYHTVPGRLCLRVLSSPVVSRICGAFLDTGLSRPLIDPFVRRHGIRLEDYLGWPYPSFNDFFSRRIRPELRPVAGDDRLLVAPCDGLLRVYPIVEGLVVPVKESAYTVAGLLGRAPLAARYRNGTCLVFRLGVEHYHRYCYAVGGRKGENVFLPGRLHTVRPIALRQRPVFVENCREYTVLDTAHFGRVVQMEVGAMLVGRIENHHGPGTVRSGQEKGLFRYGGSTVILLLEPGRTIPLEPDLWARARRREVPVLLGQTLARACPNAPEG